MGAHPGDRRFSPCTSGRPHMGQNVAGPALTGGRPHGRQYVPPPCRWAPTWRQKVPPHACTRPHGGRSFRLSRVGTHKRDRRCRPERMGALTKQKTPSRSRGWAAGAHTEIETAAPESGRPQGRQKLPPPAYLTKDGTFHTRVALRDFLKRCRPCAFGARAAFSSSFLHF